MPGKVKVKIIAGRNLPVMDRSSDTTDAYVEVKLGNTTFKTDVCRKSLNPQWNSDWYRFEMDDAELQDEPLQIRLMDHDTYTANDFIGKVYIDLNPLLLIPATTRSNDRATSSAGGTVMAGWIPVYDTMHGIRGEVNILVKLELFSDFNKFRQSSCGVQFFCSTVIPHGYYAQTIHGFVEELVVSDDPEYQWIDKIRTPRASNEARQTLFFKISGEIQRKIGLKAVDLGANSVIGYSQNFDLEGESGVVARGIGTAVTLVRNPDAHDVHNRTSKDLKFPTKWRVKTPQHTPVVMATARNYKRSYSADRGRTNPVLHRGQSTHSLKIDPLSGRLNKGSSTGSLKSDRDVGLGSRAVRILKSFLPGRQRPDEELACVEEGSMSCSSSSSSSPSAAAPRIPAPTVHDLYKEDPPVDSFLPRSNSPSSASSSSYNQSNPPSPCSSLGRDTPTVFIGETSEHESCAAHDISITSSTEHPTNVDAVPKESENRKRESFKLIKPISTLNFPRLVQKVDLTPQRATLFDVLPSTPSSSNRNNTHVDAVSKESDNRKRESFKLIKPISTFPRLVQKVDFTPQMAILLDSVPPTPAINIEPETPTSPPISIDKFEKLLEKPVSPQNVLPLIQIQPSTPSGSALHIETIASKPKHSNSAPTYLACQPLTPLHKSQSVSALVSHACAPMCRALAETEDMDLGGEAPDGATSRVSAGGTVGNSAAHPGALRSPAQPIHRRSSDSDLSITPKAGSFTGSERSCGHRAQHQPSVLQRPALNQESVEMLEYPFLTMSRYPTGFIQSLGGTVSARSVKLLERITNLEEPETRDAWWTELRMEVRSHARALGCNVVVGYAETTSICDDVCVLSASGTAALISLSSMADDVFTGEHGNVELDSPCTLCHVPYAENGVPFRVSLHRCAVCRRGKVPDVLFTTIDLVESVPTTGKGSFIHAYVARPKRDCKGEMNAKEISDGLPFLEYDLHRLLMSKLKVKGMNAIQGLKVQISIGEKLLIGLATGTAALLTALPAPHAPQLTAGNSWKDRKKLADMQKQLIDTYQKNIDFYKLHGNMIHDENLDKDDLETLNEDLPQLDLGVGNKDACILEVDDAEDADRVSLLTDPRPPSGFHVVCTEGVPGLNDVEVVRNLQMFTNVWRAKIPYGQPLSSYNVHINRFIQSIVFKLRNTRPASLSGLQLKVQLEQDEVQLSAVGMALGLGEQRPDSETLLSQDEPTALLKPRKHMPPRSRYGVDITPLSFVPGGTIERYLGNLNFFFIRESSCIREGGGLSGFVHNFLMEILAVVRAHVTALGGNAMVAYFMSECFLYNYPHKNQGQCLINVGGDVVYVSYFPTNVKS